VSKTKVRRDPREAASQQSKEDRIEDVSVKSLVFTSDRRGLSTGVVNAVENGILEETMHGASGLKIDLLDREYEAMESGLFGTRVVTTLDGTAFRLTEVSVVDDWKLAAQFEHRLVAEMREHNSVLKARRGKVTRAEFVLEMLRELKLPFRFICPELHRTQPVKRPEKFKETKTVKHGKVVKSAKAKQHHETTSNLADAGRGPNPKTLSKSPSQGLTVKERPVTAAQAKVLAIALETAQSLKAPKLARVALVVALIQENTVSNPDPGTPGDRGCLSLIDSTIHGIQKQTGHGTINPYDIAEVCSHFLTAGFTGAGGAIALARANPSDNATHIASVAQGPKVEYPHTWEAEARRIVEAFEGGGVGGSPAGAGFGGEGSDTSQQTIVRTATYEFSRGKPGEREDTFTACLRLAEEVKWSFFISGQRDIYFVNDNDLLKAEPRYIIKPDSPGLVSLTFDVEVGNRTVIIGGKRQPKASEATLKVRANRWAAPPGCVIQLQGWGPADHPWLVDSVERSLFDAEMTIQIRAPQHPLEEPKATQSGGEAGVEIEGGGEAPGGAAGTTPGPAAMHPMEVKIASQHPELKVGIRRVCAIILTQFPSITIGTTTNHHTITGTGGVSLHVSGRAADLVGPNMDAVGRWIAQNLTSRLTEGIHNPTLSVKHGSHADPSIWGSEWANHFDHIHVAVA
jgi:hypothetical protein